MEEPSVLDLLKEKINPKNWFKELSRSPESTKVDSAPQEEPHPKERAAFPWRSLFAVFFALTAQRLLEPEPRLLAGAILLYTSALGFLIMSILKREWLIPEARPEETMAMDLHFKTVPFLVCLPFILLTFATMSHNSFTVMNVLIWLATIFLALAAFWEPGFKFRELIQKVIVYICRPFVNLHFNWWNLLVIAVFMVGAFFHFYKLSSVPLDMTSDHIEKVFNVNEILNGTYPIFMPTNGGREPIQFYIIAALIKWFGASISFTTLKLSVTLVFMVGLIFVYKLGKELGNRWTGLLAMLFMGMAQWTNIITRVGLRLILCPVFVVLVMYYVLKGLRTRKRNYFIWSGIFLGLGLMGYSAFRIMPLVVVVGILIYILHQKTKVERKQAWWALGVITIFAIILALPLLRYTVEFPRDIALRTVTRMTSAEVPLADNVVGVFFSNTWKALIMPFWKDGRTWFISVTDRPGLDVVMAAFYFLGIAVVFVRWLKKRTWQDLFLLISIPILMLPSILALAFPNENPSPSRLGGAVVPIICIAVIGFQSFLTSLWNKWRSNAGKWAVAALALLIVFFSARQNYTIVFDDYNRDYANATWNSKQIGEVCKAFIDSVGTPETCYVSGLGNWVDTRLVAMVAGYPTSDFALWPDNFEESLINPSAKLFIVKADQVEALAKLQALYPQGFITLYTSPVEGRDFIAFFVSPSMP
jgi:hypothetical protein